MHCQYGNSVPEPQITVYPEASKFILISVSLDVLIYVHVLLIICLSLGLYEILGQFPESIISEQHVFISQLQYLLKYLMSNVLIDDQSMSLKFINNQ